MTRMLAFAVATLFVISAPAAVAGGPYSLDAKGTCHDSSGKFAKKEMCKAPPAKCRDIKTKKFAKCGAPNTEPVPTK